MSVFGCDHFAVCMMISCCDSDSFGRNCVGGLLVFISFNFMSRHHNDVATSFASHSFSSVCNLSSTLQLIFLLLTYFPGRDLSCMLRHQFLLLSGRDIVSDPLLVKGRKFSSLQVLLFGSRLRPPFKFYLWLHFESSWFYVAT